MHDAVRHFIRDHATDKAVTVLECGARDVNGSVRDLFPNATWVGVDPIEGPGIDHVCDFADYLHPYEVDYVISTEVLEHTQRWVDICAAAAKNLKLGGLFLVTCAGPGRGPHSAIDEQPKREWEWYRNIEPTELEEVLADLFASWKVRQVGLDVQAWAIR